MTVRAAVIGSGQLAKQFAGDHPAQCTLFGFPDIDITDPATLKSVRDFKPTVVINCAAYTNVVAAETESKAARAVNATGAGHLAALAKELNVLLIHVSTDYVFDGTKGSPYVEDDATKALNMYGQSKLEGEQAVIASGCRCLILRTAWLYGQDGPNFVLKMLSLADQKPELAAVTDKIGSPTFTRDLVAMSWALMEAKQTGLFHCVNSGSASRYDFAKKILELGHKAAKLRAASSAEFPSPAVLPNDTTLDTTKVAPFCQPRSWDAALAEYIQEVVT